MKKFLCNIVHQKFNMSHNVLMEILSRGSKVTINEKKKGTNQIKSIRRTKKMGPTINEHRNEKTYLKNWNLGALWKKSELSLVGCWKETNKEGFWQKGRDKRVRLTGFWLKVFWPPMRGASPVEWRFGCLNEWPPMRGSSPVKWGIRCLKEESVRVSDLGV